jgi:hypothetical protein
LSGEFQPDNEQKFLTTVKIDSLTCATTFLLLKQNCFLPKAFSIKKNLAIKWGIIFEIRNLHFLPQSVLIFLPVFNYFLANAFISLISTRRQCKSSQLCTTALLCFP